MKSIKSAIKLISISIFLPKFVQLIFGFNLVRLLIFKNEIKTFKEIKLNIISIFLILYCIIYGISININLFNNNLENERIFSGYANWLLWIISTIFYVVLSNKKISYNAFVKIYFKIMIFLVFLVLISSIFYFVIGIPEFSIMGRFLYISSWYIDSMQLRFMGFNDYANLIAFISLFLIPFCIFYINSLRVNKFSKVLLFSIIHIPLFLSLSRTVFLLIFFIYALFFTGHLLVKKSINSILISIILLIVFLLFLFYNSKEVADFFLTVLNSREGSTDTRKDIVKISIERVTQGNLFTNIFGYAFKEQSIFGIPYGSHSTFVGAYYKTGALGLSFIILIFSLIILKKVKEILSSNIVKEKLFNSFLIGITLFFLVEDIDGASWLIFLYFISLNYDFNDSYLNKEKRILS